MEINYNIISLIDLLGLMQGLILGLLLITISRKRDKPTIFLGLYIVAYALELAPAILEDTNIIQFYPKLYLLPINFYWLVFPLFYIYVQRVSIFSEQKTSYLTLLPGIVMFCIEIIIFFQSVEIKSKIGESLWYNLIQFSGVIYSIIIGFFILKWLKKHITELENQYSSIKYKTLQWAKVFILISIIHTSIFAIYTFFEFNFYFELIMSTINVILLYWVSVRGILQQRVNTLIPVSINEIDNKSNKRKISTNKNIKEILIKFETSVKTQELFIKPDLTIIEVAEKIGEHPKLISSIINSQFNQNFSTYINNLRIEKAKGLLNSDLINSFNIEGIGNEVGFKSKSTFYNAFKKVTGTTPLRYKSQ